MRLIIALMLMLASSTVVNSAVTRWETVGSATSAPSAVETRLTDDPLTEVSVRGGHIYLTCTRQVTVKVFTILGQQISSETLQPGTHRLRMTSKGIYILKTDTSTRRVTI